MLKRSDLKHLRPETKKWAREVEATWALECHQEKLLITACECWDRILLARETLENEPPFFTDRFKQPKEHPAFKLARDNQTLFARLCRELNLEPEPSDGPRPPRIK